MKRMLINATQPEEIRVALVDGQRLYDLDIENRLKEQKKSNIYKGKITRIEPSLEAAFVEYGAERHGFLPIKEIAHEYRSRENRGEGRPRIKDLIKEGMEVLVQVDKEERGNKGAALTTYISLAGRYMVLMPNNPKAGGISRRIEGEDRSQLKAALSELNIPKGMGIIIRTAGVGRSPEELQADLDRLVQLWQAIQTDSNSASAPHFLWQEGNVIIRSIRDYLRPDIGEVIVDNREAYLLGQEYMQRVMPGSRSRVKFYEEETPLFNRFQIESQIESAFEREVKLPSGGSIVIDITEAMIAIDINSSRATKGSNIEETALNTNLEAADEIARQMRLRDIGGLIVIDFIDMLDNGHQRDVEKRMHEALSIDRARVQLGRISKFGLMEMSRQRLRPSLEETTSKICPRCTGQGTIRSTKSLALSILRLVEEEAKKERSAEIRAIVPVTVGTFLLNEKRLAISNIEQRNSTRVVILPNTEMVTPHYQVTRLRDDDVTGVEASYKIAFDTSETQLEEALEAKQDHKPLPKPSITQASLATTAAPAPTDSGAQQHNNTHNKPQHKRHKKSEPTKSSGGFIAWLLGLFGVKPKEEDKKPQHKKPHHRRGNQRNRNRNQRNDRRDARDQRNRDKIVDNLSYQDDKNDKSDAKNDKQERSGNRNNRNRRGGRRKSNNGEQNQNGNEQKQGQSRDNRQRDENAPARRPSNRRARSSEKERRPVKAADAGQTEENKVETNTSTPQTQKPVEQQQEAPIAQHETPVKQQETPVVADTPVPNEPVVVEKTPEPAAVVAEETAIAEETVVSEAETEVVKVEEVAQSRQFGRATNDPRSNPQPRAANVLNVIAEVQASYPLDTSRPADITRNPRPLQRPANDPRAKLETKTLSQAQ